MEKRAKAAKSTHVQEQSPRRQQILKAAAQLFAERGYDAVAMTDIQRAVKLGRGALYYHIDSKEDLLYDISREYISNLVGFATNAKSEPDPRERVRKLGRNLIFQIATHQAELTVCFREIQSLTAKRHDHVIALHAAYERVWRDALMDGGSAGFFRPYDSIVLKAVLGMYYYTYLWIRPNGRQSPEAIADCLNQLTLRMLAPQEDFIPHFESAAAYGNRHTSVERDVSRARAVHGVDAIRRRRNGSRVSES